MKHHALIAVVGLLLAPLAPAASIFDGTWRPDPQRAEPGSPDDVVLLDNGDYACQTCKPPYRVKADGADHSLTSHPRFDSMSVKVVDDRRITKIARKNGAAVLQSEMAVSADGQTLTERQIMMDAGPHPVDFTSRSTRTAAGPAGSHRVSGSWHFVEADLTNHDEDSEFKVADAVFSMSDRMGRSFKARLDGTDAPYRGDPEFTSVSVKQVDARTIEETDKNAGKPVKVARWTVDADGKTMHVQFDDLHGHVQHQDGHKIQ